MTDPITPLAPPAKPVRRSLKIAFIAAIVVFVAAPAPYNSVADAPPALPAAVEPAEKAEQAEKKAKPLGKRAKHFAHVIEAKALLVIGLLAGYKLAILTALRVIGRKVTLSVVTVTFGVGGALLGLAAVLSYGLGFAVGVLLVVGVHLYEAGNGVLTVGGPAHPPEAG